MLSFAKARIPPPPPAPPPAAFELDQRKGTRHRLLLRTAKLRCRSGEYLCVVRDISEGGARLRFFNEPPPDRYLFLELPCGNLYAMERKWTDAEYSGYQFAAPVEVAEFIEPQGNHARRPIRLTLKQPARIRADGVESHAMLANLSQNGACLEAGRQIALRQPVRLSIEGLPDRVGYICWRRNFRHGVAFQDSLSLSELAHHALAIQPYAVEPKPVADWSLGGDVLCA